MVGIFVHAPKNKINKVVKIVPRAKKATVRKIAGLDLYDIFTVSTTKESRNIIPKLKRLGCSDIVEFPLNKITI